MNKKQIQARRDEFKRADRYLEPAGEADLVEEAVELAAEELGGDPSHFGHAGTLAVRKHLAILES